MGQGDYFPGCYCCEFVDGREDTRRCSLHRIPLPMIHSEGDALCKDWALSTLEKDNSWLKGLPQQYKKEIELLKSGNLYYDAGYSQRPPRSHWGRMDSLVSIKHFIFEAYVWQDSEYGWAIYPDYWKKNYALLPGLGMPCEIILDGIRSEFRVAEIGTRMPDTIKSTQEGEWNAEDYREGTVRIVYCPTSPDSLRSWLDGYFEIDRLLEEERKSVPFLGGGISIFVEVLEAGRAYSIRPAIHFHPYHVRDKSVLED